MDPVDPVTPPAARHGMAAGDPPKVWPPVRRVVETLFTGLAKLQRGRAFHPRGITFEADIRATALGRTLRVLPAGVPRGAPLQIAELEDVAKAGQLTFGVAVAGLRGPWRTVAWLTLERRVPATVSERLRFHPWNTSTDLRLVGLLSHLRAPAYEASQRTATSE